MTKIPSIVNATGKAAPLKINERYHRVEGAGVERGGLTDTKRPRRAGQGTVFLTNCRRILIMWI